MAKMGSYCKAYPVSRFRAFGEWSEASETAKKETSIVDGAEVEVSREIADTDYLFLQEDFTVTDGVFMDENVVYDKITPAWIDFCKKDLQFEIPDFAAPVESGQALQQG